MVLPVGVPQNCYSYVGRPVIGEGVGFGSESMRVSTMVMLVVGGRYWWDAACFFC